MDIELSHMDQSSVLQQSLLGCNFSPALKNEILRFLFGSLGCNMVERNFDVDPELWKGYFRFYSDQCVAVLNDSIHRCPVKTHRDFLEVVRLVQDSSINREIVKERLREKLPQSESQENEKVITDTMNLAARVGSMTLVGRFHFDVTWQRTLSWHDGSLEELLDKEFQKPRFVEEGVKLEKLFTAHNLSRIGGIKITWVDNLADHLLMHDDDSVVSIFHHASFLKLHQQSQLFPRDSDGKGLIEETLRTLAVLLPSHNGESKAWFKKQAKRLGLDVEATNCDHLKPEDRQIEKFIYWHDRLTILKETFDDAEPKSVKQWWRDRRKPVQWYNFWLAIALIVSLTMFFGVIQSIEGALQVYKAYHPTRLD